MELLSDRYRLGESIGTGGMSDVYGADDTVLGRDVAVKMLKLDLARDVNFRERFRREAQNSAKLNHRNIVAVFDTGETEVEGVRVPYIVMERVYGETLRTIIRNEGQLAPTEAAELMVPVCEALQFSHEAGIIHRDVKPANIMVTSTGDVKIMDFGIARAMDDATSAMTQTSAVIGTAQYLSPEQARGKLADARSDVYALGCVLYETVTGEAPFEGETPFAVAYQHVQEDPEPPSEKITSTDLSPTAAVNIDAVVLTAMAKHPADRYQSAQEMADDLARLARGSVTQAARMHVDTQPEGGDAPTTVHDRTATAAAAAAGAGVAAADTPSAASEGGAHRASTTDEESPAWIKWLTGVLALALLIAVAAFAWNFLSTSENNNNDEVNNQPAPNMVEVPDLTNWQRQDAINELERLGFVTEVLEEPHPEVAENHVISLNPAAGSELREGTTVTLLVSTGREITDVPDLIGLTPEEARRTLEDAGLEFNPEVEQQNSDTVEAGLVMFQIPAAGAMAAKGTQVTVAVSLGPELIRVPSVTGMNVDDARETLESLGLVAEVTYEDSLENEGQVLSVDSPAAQVTPGTTINLTVSNGQLFLMPDITRMTRADALAALRREGWSGTDDMLRIGDPVGTGALTDQGLVAVQTPGENAELRKDAEVTVRLYEFRAEELVPTLPNDLGVDLLP